MKTDLIANKTRTQEQSDKETVQKKIQSCIAKLLKVRQVRWDQFRLQVQETVRQAVKCAIQEDDMSKNFIIFGLVETEKEAGADRQ